jgi:hypothetical protein
MSHSGTANVDIISRPQSRSVRDDDGRRLADQRGAPVGIVRRVRALRPRRHRLRRLATRNHGEGLRDEVLRERSRPRRGPARDGQDDQIDNGTVQPFDRYPLGFVLQELGQQLLFKFCSSVWHM